MAAISKDLEGSFGRFDLEDKLANDANLCLITISVRGMLNASIRLSVLQPWIPACQHSLFVAIFVGGGWDIVDPSWLGDDTNAFLARLNSLAAALVLCRFLMSQRVFSCGWGHRPVHVLPKWHVQWSQSSFPSLYWFMLTYKSGEN